MLSIFPFLLTLRTLPPPGSQALGVHPQGVRLLPLMSSPLLACCLLLFLTLPTHPALAAALPTLPTLSPFPGSQALGGCLQGV